MGPLALGSFRIAAVSTIVVFCALQLAQSGPLFSDSIAPNFTASYFQFIDHSGAFLLSRNRTFKAAITNLKPEDKDFYFCVLHAPSNTIIWSANRHLRISESAQLRLSVNGLNLTDHAGNPVWSTTPLTSPVSLLQLQESGNLILLDATNSSLWESFDNPTDTIVMGQHLLAGHYLAGAASDDNLSAGDYRFLVTDADALVQWNGLTYWKLSMYPLAFKDTNLRGSYVSLNGTGLYLFGFEENASVVVIRVGLVESEFRIAKLESNGKFVVKRFESSDWVPEFTGPNDDCALPLVCGKLGLCSSEKCSCPAHFRGNPGMGGGECTPTDASYSLPPSACKFNTAAEVNSYIGLDKGVDYFALIFAEPVKHGVNLSACQYLCSRNCSCLGIFYDDSSGSCYVLQNHLGSVMSSSGDRVGYIKAAFVSPPPSTSPDRGRRNFPIAVLILLPTLSLVILVAVGIVWHKRRGNQVLKLGREDSSNSSELEIISIPGLPVRLEYQELVAATENFATQIGSGGFGTVYRGTLSDKTVVAVKRITNPGLQGKKEFYTEITTIGKIHHVNLVRLKGFCAHKRQRFLVFEYMNRGSLDRLLFGNGPVLEWQERLEIALGTARGLAYLHSGCEYKIIHCDVKPENILLHDNLQVKISDFGLSKLLSPEQSSLFTTLRGTRGYLAPEWLTSSAVSDKTDVYSYGMVLLELVRGRRNCSLQRVNNSTENESSGGTGNTDASSSLSGLAGRHVYFPLFALEMHEERRYLELADPRLEGRVSSEQVEKLARLALCCVHQDPLLRPTMVSVVGMLEGGLELGEPRLESLNFLRFYGRRFTEASTLEEGNEGMDELMSNPRPQRDAASHTTAPTTAFSYMSSQQVSGPR